MPVLEKNLKFVRIEAKEGKMLYLIGIQDFEKICKDGFVYVDKTDLVYKMAQKGGYYFLSRPRRFADDKRQIFKIGVRFSTENRCIDSWKLAE